MNVKKLEIYLRVNLLGPGPRLMKKTLPGRGLAKVETHCSRARHPALKGTHCIPHKYEYINFIRRL